MALSRWLEKHAAATTTNYQITTSNDKQDDVCSLILVLTDPGRSL